MYLQDVSSVVKAELVELIGKEHTLRVLLALRAQGPQRFGELERRLGLNPAQLDRALKWLHERLYVLPRTLPDGGGPVAVAYELAKRGHAFLEAFDAFVEKADERRASLGHGPVDALRALAG